MKPFTHEQHREALIRRRIKFVVEKGAMARLFRGGTNSALQQELFKTIKLEEFSKIQNKEQYDKWLNWTVELDCWANYSRNGIDLDRWGYFAKLINIVIYEIVSNRELFLETNWLRLKGFLHVPIDWNVTYHLNQIDTSIRPVAMLKGMIKAQYWTIQKAIRKLAEKYDIPPIWFEAAWSA